MRIYDNILDTLGNTPGLIVEPTSGNTGLGLAMAAALRGYKLVCTAPDKVPAEKITLLKARVEAIFCGSSSGAAAAGAKQVASRVGDDAVLVTLFPDSGERYLSKLNHDWLQEQGLLDEEES